MDFMSILSFALSSAAVAWGLFTTLFFWLLSSALDPDTYRQMATLGWWGVLMGWMWGLAILGTIFLYVGFGFVVSCQDAYREGRYVQKKVMYFDALICAFFFLFDIFLNIFIYTFVFWDFNPKHVFRTLTQRLNKYNEMEEPGEDSTLSAISKFLVRWRKGGAHLFAAFLETKDIDHIKGFNVKYLWLN